MTLPSLFLLDFCVSQVMLTQSFGSHISHSEGRSYLLFTHLLRAQSLKPCYEAITFRFLANETLQAATESGGETRRLIRTQLRCAEYGLQLCLPARPRDHTQRFATRTPQPRREMTGVCECLPKIAYT